MAKLAPSPFATVWTLVALAVAVLALPTAFAADTARGAEPVTEPTAAPKPRRIWSVAIGISDYQYSERGISDLQYAAADALAFDQMVANPRFGATGVPAAQRVVLTDKQATLANVRSALLDFLGKAGKDDLVVVLFAGHGSPDPLRPEEMYLLVADTDPTKLASTALPMVEMRRAFERIKSDHVVFFADACHSAAIAMPGTQLRATDAGNRIHHTLGDLSKISRNRVVVTSSEAQEKSMEGPRWQHGVFTWALLRAMDGAADTAGNRDGVVQLSEVIEFIRNRVEEATAFAQHPAVMGVYDGRLPLALAPATVKPAAQAATPPAPVAIAQTAGQPKKARAGRKAASPATLAMKFFDFENQDVEPTPWKPQIFYVIAAAAIDDSVPQEEVTRSSKPVQAALAAWRLAKRATRSTGDDLYRAQLALTERQADYQRQFALPANAAPTDKAAFGRARDTYCAVQVTQVQTTRATADAARTTAGVAAKQLLQVLREELQRDASPLTGLPPALWVILAEVERAVAVDVWSAAVDAYEARVAANPNDGSLNPSMIADYSKAIATLESFLDRFRVHPWRPQALYLRAWLVSADPDISDLQRAKQFARVLAEAPDHPAAAELHLRIAEAYFDSPEPRVQLLAREAVLSALDRAPLGHHFRRIAMYKAGWILMRLDRRHEAAAQFVALIGESKADGSGVWGPEAATLLAHFVFEAGNDALVTAAAIDDMAKATILAEAADIAQRAGDFEVGLRWATTAGQLDPLHDQAPRRHQIGVACLLGLRRFDDAAAALQARLDQFGPRSAWYAKHSAQCPPDFVDTLAQDAQKGAQLQQSAAKLAVPSADALAFAQLKPLPRRLSWIFGQCFAEQLRSSAAPRHGKVVVRLKLDAQTGLAAVDVVADTVGSPQLIECLQKRITVARNIPKVNAILQIPLIFNRRE